MIAYIPPRVDTVQRPRTYTVYCILNTATGCRYVGLTRNHKRRKNQHFQQLRQGLHPNRKLQASWLRFPPSVFEFHILEKNIPESIASDRERHYIEFFGSFSDGYNATLGGEIPSLKREMVVQHGY